MVEQEAAAAQVSVEVFDGGIEGTQNFRLDSGNGLVINLLGFGATLHSC